jgi:hypothetical protein
MSETMIITEIDEVRCRKEGVFLRMSKAVGICEYVGKKPMRRIALTSLSAVALIASLSKPILADDGEPEVLPLGCRYEGPLGHLDVVGFASPAKELAAQTPLTDAQRRVIDIHDYASMAMRESAELNPGFSGKPYVRSLAISSDSDRKQADVEVALEWRSGDGEISGRSVIGVSKCGDGRGRLTTISVEFIPQERGEGASPTAAKPALAQDRYRPISN